MGRNLTRPSSAMSSCLEHEHPQHNNYLARSDICPASSSFDGAESYGNGQAELIMGKALKELGWRRSDLVISTKIFWGGGSAYKCVNDRGLSRKHIIEGTQVSSCYSPSRFVGRLSQIR